MTRFYYPFGMQMPGRSFTVEDYRYGFNGMEVDDEIRGEGNSLDFGARMYDPRVGRFFSTDAMSGDFPNQSPYAFAANSPVYATDLNGDSVWVTITETGRTIRDDGKVVINHSAVIHITVSVLDMSGKMHRPGGGCSGSISTVPDYAHEIQKALNSMTADDMGTEAVFEDGTAVKRYNISIDSRVIARESMEEVPESDHLVVVVNDVLGKADPSMFDEGEPVPGAAGRAPYKGKIAYYEFKPMAMGLPEQYHTNVSRDMVRGAIHELGHNFNLRHVDGASVMNYSSFMNYSNDDMLQILFNTEAGINNQGTNYEYAKQSHGTWFSPAESTDQQPTRNSSVGDKIPKALEKDDG